ncbi:MAG TPA: phosphosulfolactate synthase [Bacteroides sp.]|nr:phosphosulfolactate synthase [Bacteroides sp.]
MNLNLPYIPERTSKPRQSGLTMMMDKGLSPREAEDFITSSSDYTDLVKFGFGTALITKGLEDKIKIYKEAGLIPYFGGTLFELFEIRGKFDEFRTFIDRYGIEMAEVSDGSMAMPHEEKLEYIRKLTKQVTVLSEVGSKVAGVDIPNDQWVGMMKSELEAGSWKVIGEAREYGTIGIYRKDGSANTELINDIVEQVSMDNVIWEAPVKSQQVWFIQLCGSSVNLGNIAPGEVVSLESLRLGLRGDTFFDFLPESFHDKKL